MIEKCLLNKCFGFLVPTFGPAHLISATTYTLSQHAYQLLFAGVCVAHMLRCVCVVDVCRSIESGTTLHVGVCVCVSRAGVWTGQRTLSVLLLFLLMFRCLLGPSANQAPVDI